MNDKLTTELIGKTIKNAKVDGSSIAISFTDGTIFNYYASDGGYSSWELKDGKEGKGKVNDE